MILEERLIQCEKDIAALSKEKDEILDAIQKKGTPVFGDIVRVKSGALAGVLRIVFFDSTGDLACYDCEGDRRQSWDAKFYEKTGQNIFDSEAVKRITENESK